MVVSIKILLVVVLRLMPIFSLRSPDDKCFHGFFLEKSENTMSKCSFGWTVKATRRVQTMDLKNGKIDWNCNPETAWGAVLPSFVLLSKVAPIEGLTAGPIAPGGVVELEDDREERAGKSTAKPATAPDCRWKRVQRGRKMISCFCFAENCADITETNIMDGCNRGRNESTSEREARCVIEQFPDRECFKSAIRRALHKAAEDPSDRTTATSLPSEITATIEEIEEEAPPPESPFDIGFVIKILAGILAILAVFLAIATCIYIRRKKKKIPAKISEKEDSESAKTD